MSFKNIYLENEILSNYSMVLKNSSITPDMDEECFGIADGSLYWVKEKNGVSLEVIKDERFKGEPLYYKVVFRLKNPALKQYNDYIKNWVKKNVIDRMNEDSSEPKVKMPKEKTELWRTAISGCYVSDNGGFAEFIDNDLIMLQMRNEYSITKMEKRQILIYSTGSYDYFCNLCVDLSTFLRKLPEIK